MDSGKSIDSGDSCAENIIVSGDVVHGDKVGRNKYVINNITSIHSDYDKYKNDELETIERLLYRLRIFGNPNTVIEEANILFSQLWKEHGYIDTDVKGAKAERGNMLLHSIKQILIEQGWALSETSALGEFWADKSPLIDRLNYLYKQTGDYEFKGLACQFCGDAYHVAKKPDEAIRALKKSLNYLKNSSFPEEILHTHRTIALNFAAK